MDLVISIALLGMAMVLCVFVFFSVRMPVEPAWAEEWLVANVWCVAITGLLAFGFAFGVKFVVDFDSQTFGWREGILIVGFSAVYCVLIRLMSPLRQSVEPANQTATDSLGNAQPMAIHEVLPASSGSGQRTPTPGLRKAA
ncbi:MAG: hypothetical protein R3174_01955 [Gammaproteobacteria bacterium]|nr:hypothetical protein [Gammaproteobacteria bacterium]